jgi:hypothetical protein
MRHEIEGGPETVFLVYLHQLQAFFYPTLSFHVMGQNKRKLLSIGPSRPVIWLFARSFIDRPIIPDSLFLPFYNKSPKVNLYPSRDEGLEKVISSQYF